MSKEVYPNANYLSAITYIHSAQWLLCRLESSPSSLHIFYCLAERVWCSKHIDLLHTSSIHNVILYQELSGLAKLAGLMQDLLA